VSGSVPTPIERLLSLVCRELGAAEARLLQPDEEAREDEVSFRLADGHGVAARFESPPADRAAKQRRLEILTSTFDTVVEDEPGSRRSRPPVTSTLHDELVALCSRAAAVNALIIDANSPVVWGAAHPEGVVAQPPLASTPRMAEAPANDEGLQEGSPAVLSRSAVHVVRGWPELGALRKGKHVRKVEQDGKVPLLAFSFASIYLIVLVYESRFDELRAERAVAEAIGRIERHVLALPPLDPDPFQGGGVVAMRRPRKR
jgi:hypothetical protein